MAREDPWLAIGDPVEDAVAFGNPDQPATATPAAAPGAGQPAAPDAFAAVGAPVEPTKIKDSTQMLGGFADELPDQSAGDREMPDDIRSETVRILSENPLETAASDARRYLASKGWEAGTDNFDKVIDFRAKNNVVDKNFQVLKPKPLEEETIPGAVARGVGDSATMGFIDELSGVADATKKAVTGNQSELGFWHDVHMADDVYSGRVDRDEEEHPLARIGGQLLGGLAIPVTYEGVGLRAGTLAMKEAKAAADITAQEALKIGRKAAARAVTKQMARDGAVVGGLHGIGTGEGTEGRITEGLVEAGLGAAGGAATGAVGEVVAPRIAAKAAAARGAPLTEAQDIGQAAERQGIDLLPADVGGPVTRRATSMTAQTIAGSGPIKAAAKTMTAQAKAARDRTAQAIGQALEPEAAGNQARAGAQKYITTSAEDARIFYAPAEKASKGLGIDTPKALAKLDEHIADLAETPGGAPGLATLQGLRDSLASGKATVAGIRRMRSVLRDQFIKDGLVGSDLERRVNQVVDAAAEDVSDGLKAANLPDAASLFRQGDAAWRKRALTIDNAIKPIIGTKENPRSGEQIIKTLTADLQGNNARAIKFLRALPDKEQANVRASIIGALGKAKAGQQDAAGSEFSLSTFLTNWNNVGERAKGAYFGPEARAALNDLAKVAGGAREAQGYANMSNTGGVVGNLLTLASGLGGVATFGKTIAAQYGLGRLLASPRFARWLAKAPKATADQMGYTKQLAKIAKAEPAIASDVLSLQQRLTEAFANPTMQAAAEDDTTDKPQTP